MKNEVDNLRLDYEHTRDALYAFLAAFFAITIALNQTTDETFHLILQIAMIAVAVVTIGIGIWHNNTYDKLRNSKE